MSLKVLVSDEAIETLISTTIFIKNNWGNIASDKFKKRVDQVLVNISNQPYLFKAVEFDNNVRKGLVTKQCSVYYQVYTEHIQILFFWDNRQEPVL
jgi:plasmid stabilization system protein ParE